MTAPANPPRLLVIVANGITGDSRVQKTAIAAARDGWDVTLLGLGTEDKHPVETTMGAVRVIRLPRSTHYAMRSKGHRIRRIITQTDLRNRPGLLGAQAAHNAWVRRATARIGVLRSIDGPAGVLARPAAIALGGMVRGRRIFHSLRVRAFKWEQHQQPRPIGAWYVDHPWLVDLDLVMGPVIEGLQPDVIHANDMTAIHTAAMSVMRMRARGEKVTWLYDAHEYVRGIDWPKPHENRAYREVERRYIRRADAVVTVSPEIAELLRSDYRLPETPLVVRNTPIRETIGRSDPKPSVRAACGLADDVPLMVYSGWLAPERGIGTAVAALPDLPGVHLAIVSGRNSLEREKLLTLAEELGVRNRVHVVPYVPQYAVPDYLSTADVGLICSQHTLNYEISLPTKLAEYLQGGVPVVASDVRTLAAFVRDHQIGEVFVSDDVASFTEAARLGLARRAELAAHITEELRIELSWEHQMDGLLALYRRIAPRGRTPQVRHPEISWTVDEVPTVRMSESVATGPLGRWRPLSEDTKFRVGLGPANYAGQMATFAQALSRDYENLSAEVFMRRNEDTYIFPADYYIDTDSQRALNVQIGQMQRIIGRYTHLIADAFLPVFGYLNGHTIEGDLPALKQAGIKVALVGHGSEIRHPKRHMRRYPFSLFHDAPDGALVARYTTRAELNKRIAEQSGLPLFVTTPDLMLDLPTAIWAPLVVDLDRWASDQPVMERKRPIVLHAPSQRWTKGTERILPALTKLHDSGAIELVLAERVTQDALREMVQRADIVVDQFTVGSYGTFAVEAMAAGRPTIAYVDEEVHQAVGAVPPIVSVTPDGIAEAVESLVDDPARAERIGKESVEFVRDNHDGRRTAQAFAAFLR